MLGLSVTDVMNGLRPHWPAALLSVVMLLLVLVPAWVPGWLGMVLVMLFWPLSILMAGRAGGAALPMSLAPGARRLSTMIRPCGPWCWKSTS